MKKGFGKVVAVSKIVEGIFVGFSEQAGVDEVENDVPKVDAFVNAPLGKDALGDGAEFFERVFADSTEQLLAADVAGIFELADGVVEGVANKKVGLLRVARVALEDGVE